MKMKKEKKESLNNFLNFQKENIDLGINLECELVKDGYAYGSVFKIPPHD